VTHDGLIFDLDGTLWDAAAASARGWNIALEKLGASTRVTEDDIRSVSGTPFRQCVATLLPELSPASEEMIHFIDEHERLSLEEVGGVLYDGVREGLDRMAGHHPLFVVSNCPDWYLEAFFRITGLRGCFSGWDCHGASGLHKTEMLRGLTQRHSLVNAAYVGDTDGDHDAARGAGMDFVFVSYGFGATDGPTFSFASFSGLTTTMLGD
jgi:phosphoglycolate phosphatase